MNYRLINDIYRAGEIIDDCCMYNKEIFYFSANYKAYNYRYGLNIKRMLIGKLLDIGYYTNNTLSKFKQYKISLICIPKRFINEISIKVKKKRN